MPGDNPALSQTCEPCHVTESDLHILIRIIGNRWRLGKLDALILLRLDGDLVYKVIGIFSIF